MPVPWKMELFIYEKHIAVTVCEKLVKLHKPVEITTNIEKSGNENICQYIFEDNVKTAKSYLSFLYF